MRASIGCEVGQSANHALRLWTGKATPDCSNAVDAALVEILVLLPLELQSLLFPSMAFLLVGQCQS